MTSQGIYWTSQAVDRVPQILGEIMATEYEHLTLKDRCDGCGAAAYVRVHKADVDLVFCAHHFDKMWADLMAQDFAVYEDIRDTLKVPANA